MSDEPRTPVQGRLKNVGEAAAGIVMMTGAAFVPGIVIAVCVVAILAIAHLAG